MERDDQGDNCYNNHLRPLNQNFAGDVDERAL